MLPTVLAPSAVAERCYLLEALYWVAFARFPLAFFSDDGNDAREYTDDIEGLKPSIEFEPVSASECARAGLPVNPEREDFESGDHHLEPANIKQLLALSGLTSDDYEKLRHQLDESIEFHTRQAEWDRLCDDYLDAYQARLFLALRDGRISAVGRKLPKPTISKSEAHFEKHDCWYEWLSSSEWEPIAPEFWRLKGIDWFGCNAEGLEIGYSLVLVETDTLLAEFAIPKDGPIGTVVQVSEIFVLTDGEAPEVHSHTRRGRPALDWDAFHVEMARRVRENRLPDKQEAMIAEMQHWCKQTWGVEVGRSTIFAKVKRYYDTLVRTSENI